jgi:hypothetical protein
MDRGYDLSWWRESGAADAFLQTGGMLPSAYGFPAGVRPFGVLEAIWAAVAVQRRRWTRR